MVRGLNQDRVNWISERKRIKPVVVRTVLEANSEYSENHKRQPRAPAPEGGISLSEAERRYNIPNETIGRWVKRGYLKTLLKTNRELYIEESEIARLANIYRMNPGRGSWAIRKTFENMREKLVS